MGVVYSGGTYVNTTFTGDTKANIITAMQTQLTAAGWTVVSGGGTTNLLMQTAQAAGSLNQGRVRFKDNGGSCVQVTIENISGSKVQTSSTTSGGNLLPATSKTFRILASQFRFEVFTPYPSAAREFVQAGILYIPTAYQSIITEAIYMGCNSCNDGDTTLRQSLRTVPYGFQGNSNASIVNGNLWSQANDGNTYGGSPQLRITSNCYTSGSSSGFAGYNGNYRWHDLALDLSDVLMGMGSGLSTDECLLRGQMYDYAFISGPFAADTTDTWTDSGTSHNFFNIMNTYAGSNGIAGPGSIWVATS